MDGSKVVSTPGGEGVLANFFNSLLHKKTGAAAGSPIAPGGSPKPAITTENLQEKATMRSDAAAELDRLARKKTPPGEGGVDLNASDC